MVCLFVRSFFGRGASRTTACDSRIHRSRRPPSSSLHPLLFPLCLYPPPPPTFRKPSIPPQLGLAEFLFGDQSQGQARRKHAVGDIVRNLKSIGRSTASGASTGAAKAEAEADETLSSISTTSTVSTSAHVGVQAAVIGRRTPATSSRHTDSSLARSAVQHPAAHSQSLARRSRSRSTPAALGANKPIVQAALQEPPDRASLEFEAALKVLEDTGIGGSDFEARSVLAGSESALSWKQLENTKRSLMQRGSWRECPVFSSELSGTGATTLATMRGHANSNAWLKQELDIQRDAHAAKLEEDHARRARFNNEMGSLSRELLAFSIVSRATELGVEEAAEQLMHTERSLRASEQRAEAQRLLERKGLLKRQKHDALQKQALLHFSETHDAQNKRQRWKRTIALQSEVNRVLAEEQRLIEEEERLLADTIRRRTGRTSVLLNGMHSVSFGVMQAVKKWRGKTVVSVQQLKQKAKEERIRARMAVMEAEYASEAYEASRRAADHVAELKRKRDEAEAAVRAAAERKIRIFREACDLKDFAYFEEELEDDAANGKNLSNIKHARERRKTEAMDFRGSLMENTHKHAESGKDVHLQPDKKTAKENRPNRKTICPEPPEMDPRGFFLHTVEHYAPDSCGKLSADEVKYFELAKKRHLVTLADERRLHNGGWTRPHLLLICDKWESSAGIEMSEETHGMMEDACLHHDTEGAPVVHINYKWDISPKKLLAAIRKALKKEAQRQGALHWGKIHSLAMMARHSEGSIFMTKRQLTSISSLTLMEKHNIANKEDQTFWMEIDNLMSVCKDPATCTEPDRSDIEIHLIGHQFDFNQSMQGRGLQTVLSAMMQCEVSEIIIPYDMRVTGHYFDVSKIARALEAYDREKR